MSILIVAAFIVGYILIALEHPIKIDKAGTAVLTGVICWTLLMFGYDAMPAASTAAAATGETSHFLNESLMEHFSGIASILFFLLGAMTIVELVDVHDGFRVITDRIHTTNRVKLLWILSIVTFFLSAALDNMTTAIIMSALVRRLVKDKHDMWMLAGFVIIAANAGGAWSPIGDVTTIMLWIGGQVTTWNIMKILFLPSIVSLVLPLGIASFYMRGSIEKPHVDPEAGGHLRATNFQQTVIFALGVGSLLFVPVFKTVTHLPPFLGIMLGVGVLWYVTELMHKDQTHELRNKLTVSAVLKRIDSASILFFLGILLAVSALQTSGHLTLMADVLNHTFGNIFVINTLIGLLSSVVDNVPLVAAAMGMYPLTEFAPDHKFWELLAFCAGTGGSILIIGSAAGVATMGILKIDFIWYMRKISLYALIGYLAGIAMIYLMGH